MEANFLEFSAIRGVQAGAAYYTIMCPLKNLSRLCSFSTEALPAEHRAQRVLNKGRVPAIARYVAQNPRSYVLSALCASVDGEMQFAPAASEGALRTVGRLRIGMSSTLLINDGQHRWAALEQALRDRPSLGDETIGIVIFADKGLVKSQQMFADLNSHALRPTRSIRLLYDHRDEMAGLIRRLVDAIPLFRSYTALDTSSISNRSVKLFTLSSLQQATAELLGRPRKGHVECAFEKVATEFWRAVIASMPDWIAVESRSVTAAQLRRDTVHAHGVALQAIGHAGRHLMSLQPDAWPSKLSALRDIDWSRANKKVWEGRALVAGKLSKSRPNVLLISNVLLRAMDLPLTPEGDEAERAFKGGWRAGPPAPVGEDSSIRMVQ